MNGKSLSLILYRKLLVFYPQRFRNEYGPHMTQLFSDCLGDAHHRGMASVMRLWLRTLLDLMLSALQERFRKGITMTRENFIRLSGPLLILAAALLFVSQASVLEVRYDDALGGPDLLFELAGMLWAPAMLLILMGLIGFYLRYQGRIGLLGRFGLIGAGLGALAGATGAVLMGLDLARIARSEFGWFVFIYGMFVLLGSLVLVGLATLNGKPLPRGNILPLLLGLLPWLGFIVGDAALAFIMVLFSIGWGLFGYAFYRDVTIREPEAVG